MLTGMKIALRIYKFHFFTPTISTFYPGGTKPGDKRIKAFRIFTFNSINSVTQGTKKAPNSCMIFWAKARQLDRPSVLHTSTTITECILDHPFNGSQNPPLLPEQLSNIIVQHIGGIGKTESSN